MSRPLNILIAACTLWLGAFLTTMHFDVQQLILESFAFAFAIAFGNIHNDILDYKTDLINRPTRALPSGKISLTLAKKTSLFCIIATLILSFFSSIKDGIFFTILLVLLFLYNKKLKHIPLLKNMMVALFCTTPLLLILLFNFSHISLLYPAMIFAFLLTLSREIFKDLEDRLGDLKAGIMTFPLIAGNKTSKNFALSLIFFTWMILPLPVVQGFYSKIFLIISLLTLTPLFAFIMYKAQKEDFKTAQKSVKIAMFLGLLTLVISKIFEG